MTSTLNQENGGAGNIPTWIVGQLLMVITRICLGMDSWDRIPVALKPSPVALSRLGLRPLIRPLRGDNRGQDLLPGGGLRLPAGRGCSRHRGMVGGPPEAPAYIAGGGCSHDIDSPAHRPADPACQQVGGNPTLAEEVGWPELVHSVSRVWFSLPPVSAPRQSSSPGTTERRARSTSWVAAAGLPIAVSGHNNEWFWGPGNPTATTVVAVQPGPVDETNTEAYDYLSQVLYTHPRCGHAPERCRDPQPGMGRTCLHLHRAATSLGRHVAPASPVQLSRHACTRRSRTFHRPVH